MVDFEAVKSIRGAKLSDHPAHVRDVLAISLAEEDVYQVGKLVLASYDFVPYALTGLSSAMRTPQSGVRASTVVTVPLEDDAGGTATVEKTVSLYGPGDVLGVDRGQIVRRYPAPGSTNAEETFHAHIEFDRPEVPWAFSAETPAPRMRAWLALVVFERDEVEWEPAHAGLQPIAAVPAAALPSLDEAWAWAHAQATGGSAGLSARLSTAYAPVNVSRLIASRVLTQNTNYVACVVPTTDVGRRAGLGLAGGTLGPAWTAGDGTVRLPVYDRWEFRTAPEGDFPRLARRLEGIDAPWRIGRRIMDTARPGDPLTELAPDEAGRRQVIRCALYSPNPPPPGSPPEDAAWTPERVEALKVALERPAVVEGTAGTNPGEIPDLPIVGPRVYGRGQRGTSTVPAGDWFAELNLSPVNRVVAGLGTRVVIKDQELLMQAAWAQVGEIEKANRALVLAEVARNLAATVHARLAKVDPGRLLQMTRPVAGRVRLEGAALTLDGQTVRSATPTAALGGSFRRALRPAGPLARRLATGDQLALRTLVATEGGARDFARPYTGLRGIGGLSTDAIEALDATALGRALGTTPEDGLARVKNATATMAQGLTLAAAVTTPAVWKEPNAAFRPGVAATQRIVGRIRDMVPADPEADVVKARWLGGLAAGLATSNAVDGHALGDIALRLDDALSAVVAKQDVTPHQIVGVGPAPVRPNNARMLRAGAAGGAAPPAALPAGAAGRLADPIVRPEAGLPKVVTAFQSADRARLDRFRTPQGTRLASWVEAAEKVTSADIRSAITSLIDEPGVLKLARTPVRPVLDVRSRDVLARLDPGRTVVDTMRARLGVGAVKFDAFAERLIRPIMAAPRFDRPMYKALDLYDREWLVPGLGTLPEPELVTLLSANDAFSEAFLVGLSDEMGRELLWREYPTDQRGTYFHRFWDPVTDELAQPIHRFTRTKLGSHLTFGSPDQSGRAVVVIRGEVVRRYPDLTVMALQQTGGPVDHGLPVLPENPQGKEAARALFHAMLPPDVLLVGLDITIKELRKPGWWISLGEHPQAPRFRRPEQERDLVGHEIRFSATGGAATGAEVARNRLEQPTRVVFRAAEFLPSVP